MQDLEIRRTRLEDDAARSLIAALNAELLAVFPEPGATHFTVTGDQVAEGEGAFLIALLWNRAVGCGAVRRLDPTTAELKRMYVAPQWRGQGIGRALVRALEDEARRLGATRVVLETGARLHRAMALYEGLGYRRIPPYGEYLSTPDTSICLGKSLALESDPEAL